MADDDRAEVQRVTRYMARCFACGWDGIPTFKAEAEDAAAGHNARCHPEGNHSMIPYRFTLSRKAGWEKPPFGIGCGRPSRWGNPYIVGQPVPPGHIRSVIECHQRVIDVPGVVLTCTVCGGTGCHRKLHHPDGLRPARLDFPLAVRLFDADLHAGPELGLVTYSTDDVVAHLAGNPLGCWCPAGAWCHVNVLLRAANGMPDSWLPEHREGPPWPKG